MTQESTHYAFEAEVSQVLSLVINSLYSNKEIFVRELISNASDAIDKARFASLSQKDLLGQDTAFHIRLTPDAEAGTLSIEDNGIGMTKEELIENLGTIAHSGSRAFLEGLKDAIKESQDSLNLIGQFGVGFYSAFLVADRVEVLTRAAQGETGWRWVSEAKEGYTIEEVAKPDRGTRVVLHLKEDQKEYLEPWRLKNLVSRYADYVSHPIEMPKAKDHDDEEQAEQEAQEAQTFEQVNQASALWRRSPDDITPEQYSVFYKHLTHDWQDPLMQIHFHVEGTREFTGLLFVPGQPPFDMFTPDAKRGVRLYVKRVFIMEDYEEVVPQWLRFVRGVIDSDDLPLNVSRELLQDSATVRVIQKQVVKKVLQMLEQSAANDAEQYLKFWEMFGRVLKEGLHYAPTQAKTLGKLVRYHSSTQPGWTSLAQYVERMKEGQDAIYYAIGASQSLLEHSPHLEALKARGFEVLYMTDAVDEWAMHSLREFEDKPLVSALSENLDLGTRENDASAKEEKAAQQQKFSALTDHINHVLADQIQEVRLSERLENSPVCLVIPEGGLHAHTERLLRAQDQDMPKTKRILEVNPKHSLIQHLQALQAQQEKQSQVQDWIELLYDQALLTEGSPIEDPAAFARRMTHLMEQAASQSQAGA